MGRLQADCFQPGGSKDDRYQSGGARFVSALMFPVDSDVILQLALVLEGTQFCMEGFVVSRTVIEEMNTNMGFASPGRKTG